MEKNTKNERKGFADSNKKARFTAPPEIIEIGNEYSEFISILIKNVSETKIKTVLDANSSMIMLYWNIGDLILKKQKQYGWGAKVIDRISFDLKKKFPEMKGFSPRNLKYMRKFAEVWQDKSIVQQVVAQIPWHSNIILLEKSFRGCQMAGTIGTEFAI